jgi:hypothetical protein
MSLIRHDELEAILADIFAEAPEVGRRAEDEARRSGLEIRRTPRKPTDTDSVRDELRDLLEREVIVAKPPAGEDVISERELNREIAKRALAHLKLSQLRELAEQHGLATSGDLDEVAERLGAKFAFDGAAIAQLVVEHETEPPPDRRFATRLYPMSRMPDDLTGLTERLERLAGQYFRVGIAKWLVVDRVSSGASYVRWEGTYRYYRADAEQVDDEYELHSYPDRAGVVLTARGEEPFVVVEAAKAGESNAIVTAFQHATGIPRSGVPSVRAPEGPLFSWEPRTVFLMDLLNSRFGSPELAILNLTAAGFATPKEETVIAADDTEITSRPALKSVRFQGQHLLDSRPACQLIDRGQALVDVSFLMRFANNTESAVVPVVLRFEQSHINVMTGSGAVAPALSRAAHDLVVRGVGQSLANGLRDEQSLRQLAGAVHDRAQRDAPVDKADFFGGS